jgi:hypothetical protein
MVLFRQLVLGGALFCWSLSTMAIDPENFRINADITATLDDNQSRAERRRDQVEDRSVSAQVSLSWFRPLGQRSLMILSWFGESEKFDEVALLDRHSLGSSMALRWQPSSAFSAPIVEWNASVQDDNIRTDQRDATLFKTQLFVTRRFTDRITMSLGGEYRMADSRSTVFDLEDTRLFWNFDYLLRQKYALYFTYSYLQGDVFSSAQRIFCNGAFATDILPLINAATAIEGDYAYNETFCGEWIAYRLNGKTSTYVAGVNRPVGKSMAFDISLMHVDVDADMGNHYERNLVRASLLKRF